MSNDSLVRQWLSRILWILTLHAQTRISALVTFIFYIPLGKGMLRTLLIFVTFYLVAVSIVGLVVLSDLVITSVGIKLDICVGATSIAQMVQASFNWMYLWRLDWHAAGVSINARANADEHVPRVRVVDGPEGSESSVATSPLELNGHLS